MKITYGRDGSTTLEGTLKELYEYVRLVKKSINKERLIITDFSGLFGGDMRKSGKENKNGKI